jgi:MFS family permease
VTERRPLGSDYWRFWSAAAASNLGDGIRLGAVPLLALRLTDDARLIAAASAVTLAPWFLFGAVGGAIVDRGDRRRLMLIGQIARAVLVGALAISIATDSATIGWLLVVGFGLGTGEVIVDLLDQVVGVTLGAVLFAVATELPFWVDCATFVVGAAFLVSVRRPLQGDRTVNSTLRDDIIDGFRFLFGHRLLRTLAGAIATINLAGNISFGVIVILVVDELGAAEATFGIVLGIGAVGGVLGSLLAEVVVTRLGRRLVLSLAPSLLVLAQVANAIAPNVGVVAAALFVASFAVVVANVPGQSLRQSVTPEHLLGRVVASFRVFGMGAAPLGAVAGGFITEALDVRAAMVVAAVGMGAGWLLMLRALTHLPTTTGAMP